MRDVAYDDEGFALDAYGKRIEVTCAWCNGDGCEACNDSGLLWKHRQDDDDA